MVVVCRKIAVRTSAARAGSTSACSVWAGRPFFIRIGVSHASEAPASSSAAITAGHTRGSRSSMFVSISRGSAVVDPVSVPAGTPTKRRRTFA